MSTHHQDGFFRIYGFQGESAGLKHEFVMRMGKYEWSNVSKICSDIEIEREDKLLMGTKILTPSNILE
jgi:hypothetical protein